MNSESQPNCVAIFERHQDAEAAIRQLKQANFDIKKISIVGRDYHTEEHATGFYNAGDRVKYWGKNGAFCLYEGLKTNATIVVVPSTALESMQLGGLAGLTALTMRLGQDQAKTQHQVEIVSQSD